VVVKLVSYIEERIESTSDWKQGVNENISYDSKIADQVSDLRFYSGLESLAFTPSSSERSSASELCNYNCIRSPTLPVNFMTFKKFAQKLAVSNIVYSRAESVFILEHYFALKFLLQL
jgi:hypothetical protein